MLIHPRQLEHKLTGNVADLWRFIGVAWVVRSNGMPGTLRAESPPR